jgi:hypothetical protein
VRTDLIALEDLSAGDLAAWRELALRAIEPNPYVHPDFVLPLGLAERRPVALLRARIGETWTACIPVVRARSWRRVPAPGLVTWRHPNCLLSTPLVAADAPGEALAALVAGAGRQARTAYLALEWTAAEGPVAAALTEGAGRRRPAVLERFERATLDRRPANDYLAGRLSGRRRKDLRRLARRLEAELGGTIEVRDRAGEAAAVEEFLRLEASGWKAEAGTALARRPGEPMFFRAMCRAFAAEGRLQLLSLEVAGRVLAMQCNLIDRDGLFCFKVARDDTHARDGVGVQLEIAAIDVFHERTELAWMDSCAEHDNHLINQLWPDRRALHSIAVPAGPLRLVARPAVRARLAAARVIGRRLQPAA